MVLTFLDAEGHHYRNRNGEIIRRMVMLANGEATFLDLNYDEYPPGPSRLQLRAVVNAYPPGPTDDEFPSSPIVPSVEIFNNANGRTVVFIGNPGVIRGFNPQPDPPL